VGGSHTAGRGRTVELAQDAVHGAGAAAAGHADVEFVGVLRGHGVRRVRMMGEMGMTWGLYRRESERRVGR
jgi:hypothetical protein